MPVPVEAADVHATWFVTHQTELLERLRANPKFELGIHPNYLPLLLEGSTKKGSSAEQVLENLLAIVPEAKSVRTHSLVQGGRLTEIYHRKGITHEANAFVPVEEATLTPWVDWFGIIRVPHRWEDDYWCYTKKPSQLISDDGLTVLCFHPIHVFLNTDILGRYEDARQVFQDPDQLLGKRFAGNGVRTQLQQLLSRVS